MEIAAPQDAAISLRWSTLRRLRPFLYLAVLAAVNLYVCRGAFYTPSTGHFNSMHGEWMALARLGNFTSWKPQWWPWWGAGVPLEYTYAPLVPALTAALARFEHNAYDLAFNQLSAIVYCALPIFFYLGSWRLSGKPGRSFVAALACSLLTPFNLLMPDTTFHWSSVRDARRFVLVFEWDDLPHLLSLSLLPLGVWWLARALGRRAPAYYAMAGAAFAAMMLANMFGAVLVALTILTVPLLMDPFRRLSNFVRAAAIGAGAYIFICPWLPPSLILTIRSNSILDGEAAKGGAAIIALGIVGLAAMNVARWARGLCDSWTARWLAVIGCVVILIPLIDYYAGLHFVPQAGRYKNEADLALIWVGVFAAGTVAKRFSAVAQNAIVALLVVAAIPQIIHQRRYARAVLRPVDVASSIEFRAAQWTEQHLPGARVMLSGSMATWGNVFTNQQQVAAEAYTTTPNFENYLATYMLYSGQNAAEKDAAISVLWLQAFGAKAVAVPGPQSPEYWKPYANPRKFDGVLPVLWAERDTKIYQLTGQPYTLAHVVRAADLVQHAPVNGLDTAEIQKYVTAIANPAMNARFRWNGNGRAVIDARLAAGDIVSAQVTYFPGWRVRANGMEAKVRRDGIGLMAIETSCTGECHIELDYQGSAELRYCRVMSAGFMGLLLLIGGFEQWRRLRRV